VRILVVEDDPLIREFVVEALREEGYEVIHAATDGMRWKASHRKYLFVELLARSPFLLASGGGPGNDQTLNTGAVETTCEAFKLGRDFDSCLQHPLHGLSFWIHRRFLRPRRVDFVCEPPRQRSQQCLLLLI
jgi:hypothetical protein